MLFIRTTLLLGLGVLVLPTDRDSQARVYDGAKSAVHWTSTFCERNPATCVQGQQAWAVFVKKAEFGVKIALDLVNERNQRPETVPAQIAPAPARPAPATAKRASGMQQAIELDLAPRSKAARIGG